MNISIKRIALALGVVLVIPLGLLLSYLAGYDNGNTAGQRKPASCPDRSLDGKVLSKIIHDAGKSLTTCTYLHEQGATTWQRQV